MGRPVMLWGVREAAGRFERAGLRAAERCQQSASKSVWELCVMRKHAKMIRKTAGEKQNFKACETGMDMQILLTLLKE